MAHSPGSPDLLRFTTAGSVDDGKSTLIGRLLYDAKAVFEDQYEAVERSSARRGEATNLALLTDGLRAEREQGITIDVAYRYFSTPKRSFIIADTPGHAQYTRNMVTGASTAELAVVLVDARKGVLEQSRRHAFIASLLQIPHMVVAVNKMDAVDYAEARYNAVVADYQRFAAKLSIPHVAYIPISALHGDNVVEASTHMPWYHGPTLLHHLETVNVGASLNRVDFRFPVQHVLRPHQDFRGYAGQVASGGIRPGEGVVVLPGGQASTVKEVVTFEGPQPQARAGQSVALTLADELDVSRGDMLVRPGNQPLVSRFLDADLCWMSEAPLRVNATYILQHTTRHVSAFVSGLTYVFDVNTLHRVHQPTLGLNEIGRVEITATQPLCFDPYRLNRQTGGFILVDPDTNATVAAGMIRGEAASPQAQRIWQADQTSPHVVWEGLNITRAEREARNTHRAAVIWLTGLSASGKSTIARGLERRLFEAGGHTMLLDGDNVRHGLSRDLGFSAQDRAEHLRRVGEVARLFFEQGTLVVCAFISPAQADRDAVRGLLPEGRFVEVFVDCPVETCIARDPKGLYQKALAGEIAQFTGVSAPYEAPTQPEVTIRSDQLSIDEAVDQLWTYLGSQNLLPKTS